MAALVVRATDRCNSRCRYCERPRGRRTLDGALLELLLGRIREYLDEDPGRRLDLLWHGGEPMVLGAAFFRSVLEAQQRLCAGRCERIAHGIQTNLTRLTPEMVEALRGLGVRSFGTSFDPAPGLRGPASARDPLLHQRRFLRGIGLLEREGIAWGLVYVVTRPALERPVEILHLLANLSLPARVSMNPVLLEGGRAADLAIGPMEYADFLGAVARAWWRCRHRMPSLEPLSGLVSSRRRAAAGEPPRSGTAPTDEMLNIEPDGEITPCRRPPRQGAVTMGNLADRPLSDLLAENASRQREERERKLAAECAECRDWDACLGGCSLDGFAQGERIGEVGAWCSARRHFTRSHLEPLMEPRHGGSDR